MNELISIYSQAVTKFLALLVLGFIFSPIPMYITEALKKFLAGVSFFKGRSNIIIAVNAAVCFGFGVLWGFGFAKDVMSAYDILWFGIFSFLGSTTFYTKLKDSDGFFGSALSSFSSYFGSSDIVDNLIETAKEEAAKAMESVSSNTNTTETAGE